MLIWIDLFVAKEFNNISILVRVDMRTGFSSAHLIP